MSGETVTESKAQSDREPEPGPEPVDAPDGSAEDKNEDQGRERPALRRRTTVLLGVACALLALTGGVLLQQAYALRNTPAAANSALTDAAATSRVNGDVATALAKVFSYEPGGTEATARSAREVLSGRAARQYRELFGQVQDDVRKQKLALTTQAVRVGTVSLRGDTAHVLVFLDQTARRGKGKPATSAAQLSVTAELRDDTWRIVDIKAR